MAYFNGKRTFSILRTVGLAKEITADHDVTDTNGITIAHNLGYKPHMIYVCQKEFKKEFGGYPTSAKRLMNAMYYCFDDDGNVFGAQGVATRSDGTAGATTPAASRCVVTDETITFYSVGSAYVWANGDELVIFAI